MPRKLIAMKGITKSFSGVPVLKGVDFNVYEGRIMALLGENGAGKSTLMKILTGAYQKNQGEIIVDGEPIDFQNIRQSQAKGIAIIHQELNLVKDLSIAENIFLGREPLRLGMQVNWKKLNEDAYLWLEKLGLNENPKTLVKNISVGKQQLVEIAKALSLNARILIMDEPTGALTVSETEKLFQVIQELKAEGKSIVYISHRLKEIFEICDDVTILRDGQFVSEQPISELDEDKIIESMVGRKLTEQYPRVSCKAGETVLEVKNISNQFVEKVNLSLRKNEIVGISGLMGSGRTELARTIYGIYKAKEGDIYVKGEKIKINHPTDALNHGIAYVSEDRKNNGIVLGMCVRENVTLASLKKFSGRLGNLHRKKEESSAQQYMKEMSIKTSGSKQLLKHLSGGNQQKVSLAKNLNVSPEVLILDEPTRGVDVGAKKEIYDLINTFKKQGMSILMISSEIPEILGMSDRIVVMHEGRIMGELSHEEANQEKIMSLAVGKEVRTACDI
ncbi:sugar ABC transporter ATP-binding protein [Anaerovorax sp. IOR16]|uniref:sugar ABC transporter ATP-binding protein n=1 Tax=Anaerovorax sp. IOR16 TaxID=2773458 RepID=UPI002ED19B67